MNDGRIHIALVANDRYRPGLLATRHSIIAACADPDRLAIHEFGDADMARFDDRIRLADYNGSKLPYLRIFLPELLPDCDWVIYSDVDTLWFRDPQELWRERDDAAPICWVRDLQTSAMEFARWTAGAGVGLPRKYVYACSGIALINLRKWRETNFTARAVDFLKTHGCPPYADQDVLNALLAGEARMLDPSWDVMIPPRRRKPCVLHITGVGLRFQTEDCGNVPQYAFWFAYYRRNVLKLPPRPIGRRLRAAFRLLDIASLVLGPVLAAVDRVPGPYAWKFLLMRIRRRLAFARFALSPGP